MDNVANYLICYAKDVENMKYRQLYKKVVLGEAGATRYNKVELPDGSIHTISEYKDGKFPEGARFFFKQGLTSRTGSESTQFPIEFEGKEVTSIGDLQERLVYYSKDTKVKVKVMRKSGDTYEEKEIEVTLGDLASIGGRAGGSIA